MSKRKMLKITNNMILSIFLPFPVYNRQYNRFSFNSSVISPPAF